MAKLWSSFVSVLIKWKLLNSLFEQQFEAITYTKTAGRRKSAKSLFVAIITAIREVDGITQPQRTWIRPGRLGRSAWSILRSVHVQRVGQKWVDNGHIISCLL